MRIPQFLRVCRNCGSLHKEISEVFNKNNSMTGMFLVLNGMIFNFIEAQVQIISDQLYIWESYMHISICLVVATIFQIRNCMLMSWDKKHENLRPFNKTFLLYTVILPSRNGIVQGLSIPLPSRGILMTKLWLFLRMTKGDTPGSLRRLVTDHQLKTHPVQPLVGPRDRSCKHSKQQN